MDLLLLRRERKALPITGSRRLRAMTGRRAICRWLPGVTTRGGLAGDEQHDKVAARSAARRSLHDHRIPADAPKADRRGDAAGAETNDQGPSPAAQRSHGFLLGSDG
ncbi:hypothetical protein [Nonomuraea roseola]|uniref:hypothetical protein n=1 Tax=Nonomuraea roseola TaxID=46179 RepID=UPI0031F7258F